MDGMRLFVAAYPPEQAVADLEKVLGTLAIGRPPAPGRSLRLVPAERLHLTLAFLGDVPDQRLGAVQEALAVAAVGPAPEVSLAGGGRFGRGRFTTVWIGVRGDTDRLTELAGTVRTGLRRARLPYDRKPMKPHVTLARPGDRLSAAEVAADLRTLDAYAGPQWTVGAIELVRSHLGPQIRYERLARYDLCGR